MIGRRGFLGGLLALVAAPSAFKALPAVVPTVSIPPVAPIIDSSAPTSAMWAGELGAAFRGLVDDGTYAHTVFGVSRRGVERV